MSKVFFISDLHIGHRTILKYSADYRYGDNIDQHDRWLVEQWNSVVNKNDLVYVLGDVCFDKNKMYLFHEMKGTKYLLPGNHDLFPLEVYLQYFEKIKWFSKYKHHWISHAPIHPDELRGRKNIHGHVHAKSIKHKTGALDDRYVNVSVEVVNGTPITYEQIMQQCVDR